MGAISFSTPVAFMGNSTWCEYLLEGVDDYFSPFSDKKAVVIAAQNGSYIVNLEEQKCACLSTTLKVVSYFTVILPLLLLIVKVGLRSQCEFTVQGVKKPAKKKQTRSNNLKLRHESSFYFPKKEGGRIYCAYVEVSGSENMCSQKWELKVINEDKNGLKTVAQTDPFELCLKCLITTGGPATVLHQLFPFADYGTSSLQNFVHFLLTPYECLDNDCRFVFLSPDVSSFILDTVETKQIKINPMMKLPGSQKSIFATLVGTPHSDWVIWMLQHDETLIRDNNNYPDRDFLSEAILIGETEQATALYQAATQVRFHLSVKARTLYSIATDPSYRVTSEHFSREIQEDIYRVAHLYGRKHLLEQLRVFQQKPKPALGSSLFSSNMDYLQMEKTLFEFLKDLRENKLLLTQKEFNGIASQFQEETDGGEDINLMLDHRYIKNSIEKWCFVHLKIPKTVAVYCPSNDGKTLRLRLEVDGVDFLGVASEDFYVYQEKIEPSKRQLTKEELKEILSFLQIPGQDGSQFIITDHGVYLMEEEISGLPAMTIDKNLCFLRNNAQKKDRQWLEKQIEELQLQFNLREAEEDDDYQKELHKDFERLGHHFIQSPFEFELDAIF